MHESSLARALLAQALDAATRAGSSRVKTVRARFAETETLHPDAISFHFLAHAQGTRAEGARLELECQHIEACCKACSRRYAPEHHLTLCPQCGSTEADLLGEPGLWVDSIEVE